MEVRGVGLVTVTPVRGVTGDELRVSARSSVVNVAGSIAWSNVTSTPWTGWLVGLVIELIAVTVGPWTVKVPVRKGFAVLEVGV